MRARMPSVFFHSLQVLPKQDWIRVSSQLNWQFFNNEIEFYARIANLLFIRKEYYSIL